MKVNQLMSSDEADFAKKTGRDLAKMFRKTGLVPTFKEYVVEVESYNDIKQLQSELMQLLSGFGITSINFSGHFQDRILPGGRDQIFEAMNIATAIKLLTLMKKKELDTCIEEDKTNPTPRGIEVILKWNKMDMNLIFAIKNQGTHIEFMTIMKKPVAKFKSDDRPWSKIIFV